jgi:hypothetical protein
VTAQASGPLEPLTDHDRSNLPAQPSAAEHARVAELQCQLEAGRVEVASLRSSLAATRRQRDEAREQLAAERELRVVELKVRDGV